MPAFPWIFAIFLAVPIAEVYLLISVGGIIGAWPTIALVVLTAVLGAALMRAQGLATVMRAQQQMAAGDLPALTLVEGVLILLAGALLLTPGFATDAIGFLLLLPPSRQWLVKNVLLPKITVASSHSRGPSPGPSSHRPDIYDGEFKKLDDND